MARFNRSMRIGLVIAAGLSSATVLAQNAFAATPSGIYSATLTIYPPGQRPQQGKTCVRFSSKGVFADALFNNDGTTRAQNGVWSATKVANKRWQATLAVAPFSYNGTTPKSNTIQADGIAAGRNGSGDIIDLPLKLVGKRVSNCSINKRSLSELFPNLQFLQPLDNESGQ
jgi:hypothetical protein